MWPYGRGRGWLIIVEEHINIAYNTDYKRLTQEGDVCNLEEPEKQASHLYSCFLFFVLSLKIREGRVRGDGRNKAKRQARVTTVITDLKSSCRRASSEDGRALQHDTAHTWTLVLDYYFISTGQCNYYNSGR